MSGTIRIFKSKGKLKKFFSDWNCTWYHGQYLRNDRNDYLDHCECKTKNDFTRATRRDSKRIIREELKAVA